jgi:hypothetical protein
MLLLKNSLIAHPKFQQAVAQLSMQKLPVKTAFNLKVLVNRIEQKIKDSEKVKYELMSQYCQKNEDGSLKPYVEVVKNEDGTTSEFPRPGTVIPVEETKAEFEQKFADFLNFEHEIKGDKLSAEALGDISMSAMDIHLLEPIFDMGNEEPALGGNDNVLPLK